MTRIGDAAALFTQKALSAAPFTVWTCGQDARGSSSQQRLYGIIRTGQGDLAEMLVKNGLARIYGKRVTLPDGTDSRAFLAKLGRLEDQAKLARLGGWGAK